MTQQDQRPSFPTDQGYKPSPSTEEEDYDQTMTTTTTALPVGGRDDDDDDLWPRDDDEEIGPVVDADNSHRTQHTVDRTTLINVLHVAFDIFVVVAAVGVAVWCAVLVAKIFQSLSWSMDGTTLGEVFLYGWMLGVSTMAIIVALFFIVDVSTRYGCYRSRCWIC